MTSPEDEHAALKGKTAIRWGLGRGIWERSQDRIMVPGGRATEAEA